MIILITYQFIIGNLIVYISMINNRLIADNTIKTPLKGPTYFSISKKLIAFQIEKQIKIKTLHRQSKDIDIHLTYNPLCFSLSQMQPWLFVLTPSNLLEIFLVEYINGINEGSYKKVGILHNVSTYRQNNLGLVVGTLDKTLKNLSFKEIIDKTEINLNIDCKSLKSLSDLDSSYLLITEYSSDRILLTKSESQPIQNAKQPITQVIDRVNNSTKYQKYSTLSYLNKILSFYKERYVFQHKDDKQVQIFDIEQSKLVGKFSLEGAIKYSQIRQNLFLIVTSKQANDYFHFFVLNSQPSSTQPLITNRACYEKGKSDFIKYYNLPSSQVIPYLDKKKNIEVSDAELTHISDNTSSLVYILNKAKEKVEVIKLDHSKLLKSPFGQQKVDMIVYSKKSEKEIKEVARQENNEIERSRVHSTIEAKIGGQSMEDMQKRFVENLIDIKLKSVLKKFDQLQTRVANLEKIIQGINSKIEQNIQKVNRKQIRQKVQQMFDNLAPQFEKYFSEIFKQVSGVFEQGITYYNLKLSKQAEFHKQALTQVVSDTFKFTEEVAEISKKEQSVSEKTEDYLKKILESKKKWVQSTEELESRVKEVPSPVLKLPSAEKPPKTQSKVFVRADLNYPSSKRET